MTKRLKSQEEFRFLDSLVGRECRDLRDCGARNTAEMMEASGQDASLCRKIKNGSNESTLNASP